MVSSFYLCQREREGGRLITSQPYDFQYKIHFQILCRCRVTEQATSIPKPSGHLVSDGA